MAETNDLVCDESAGDRYRGILGLPRIPVVAAVEDLRASLLDAAMTHVVDDTLAKIMSLVRQRVGLHPPDGREAPAVLGVDGRAGEAEGDHDDTGGDAHRSQELGW